MIRLVSYPIVRAFTSICIGLALLCPIPTLAADNLGTLAVKDEAGNNVALSSFKGKAIVINLWASWCGPCVEEMPTLVSIQKEYKDKGLLVLALSEDDSIAEALKFYKDKSITELTPYFDKDHFVWMSLKARGLPTTILIDRNGNEVKTFEGAIDQHMPEFKKAIDQLVGEN